MVYQEKKKKCCITSIILLKYVVKQVLIKVCIYKNYSIINTTGLQKIIGTVTINPKA